MARKRIVRWLKILGGLMLATPLLVMTIPVELPNRPPSEFDVQVVLGGNARERVEISYQLWRLSPGPVLVTGDGGHAIRQLNSLGIPKVQLIHEDRALSTFDNAAFTLPILAEIGATKIVVVTSDFHSARAMSCFRKLAPELDFYPCTEPVESRSRGENFQLRFRERIKRIGYGFKYGISPWS